LPHFCFDMRFMLALCSKMSCDQRHTWHWINREWIKFCLSWALFIKVIVNIG
jgi:hypothetical protein